MNDAFGYTAGPSGVAIATLVIAILTTVAALGGSRAAWLQARAAKDAADASKVAAKEAAAASDRAANKAADALAETTALAAYLSESAEHARWVREAVAAAISEMLGSSKNHARAVRDMNEFDGVDAAVDREHAAFDDLVLCASRLSLFADADVVVAAYELMGVHTRLLAERDHYPTLQPLLFNLEDNLVNEGRRQLGITGPAYESVPPTDGQ